VVYTGEYPDDCAEQNADDRRHVHSDKYPRGDQDAYESADAEGDDHEGADSHGDADWYVGDTYTYRNAYANTDADRYVGIHNPDIHPRRL
jgi:hypothetical protein